MAQNFAHQFKTLQKSLQENQALTEVNCNFTPLKLNPFLEGLLEKLPPSISKVYASLSQVNLLWSHEEDGVEVNGGACLLKALHELSENYLDGLKDELEPYYSGFYEQILSTEGQNPLDNLLLLESKMGLGSQQYIFWVLTKDKPEGQLWYWKSDGDKFPMTLDFEGYLNQVVQTKGQFGWERFFMDLEAQKAARQHCDDLDEVYPSAAIGDMEDYLGKATSLFPNDDQQTLLGRLEILRKELG